MIRVPLDDSTPVAVHEAGGVRVWVMDSIAFGGTDQTGDVIVTGSHGGTSAGEYAGSFGVLLTVCNDAGRGKNDAGVAGLLALDHHGMAGVAVSHDSARIGDGGDVWANGIVSWTNAAAAVLGVRVGRPVRTEVVALLDRLGAPQEEGA